MRRWPLILLALLPTVAASAKDWAKDRPAEGRRWESQIPQLDPRLRLRREPMLQPLPKDPEDSAGQEPPVACTPENAMSPACAAAVQSAR
jgi:hypothetical protein